MGWRMYAKSPSVISVPLRFSLTSIRQSLPILDQHHAVIARHASAVTAASQRSAAYKGSSLANGGTANKGFVRVSASHGKTIHAITSGIQITNIARSNGFLPHRNWRASDSDFTSSLHVLRSTRRLPSL